MPAMIIFRFSSIGIKLEVDGKGVLKLHVRIRYTLLFGLFIKLTLND